MGGIFLVAGVHDPGQTGRRIYASLLAAAGLLGMAVAGRHLWLQNMPADTVPACGPGLAYMLEAFPLTDVLEMVFTGSGECAEVKWSLLGLSMPAWVLIAVLVTGSLGFWINWTGRLKLLAR
jgi:disulfide bond formation protein DsbB